MLAVLDKAADIMPWNRTPAPGTGLGIAIHDGFGSMTCQVAEVSFSGDQLLIKRICCVADCGTIVNPSIAKAQIESGIVFGLTATIKSGISINQGRVEQSNFHDFPLLRMHEMPQVDIYLIQSDQPPGGVGEIGVPPIAPAIANAIFAASGKRIRSLPLLTS
jgi:CO/xanthine dehydrogenase Mo-binding subunit